jgi:hypothetical protein
VEIGKFWKSSGFQIHTRRNKDPRAATLPRMGLKKLKQKFDLKPINKKQISLSINAQNFVEVLGKFCALWVVLKVEHYLIYCAKTKMANICLTLNSY